MSLLPAGVLPLLPAGEVLPLPAGGGRCRCLLPLPLLPAGGGIVAIAGREGITVIAGRGGWIRALSLCKKKNNDNRARTESIRIGKFRTIIYRTTNII